MFQYTTETIINSNEGHLKGAGSITGKRFAAVALDATDGLKAGADALLIDGVGMFLADKISAAYKNAYAAAVNEVAVITIPAATAAGKVMRLRVGLRQSGISTSNYADAQLRHIKPFFYEIEGSTTAADNAAALAELINKEMQLTDFGYFKAEASGASLTLTAADCYTRFNEISLVEVHEAEDSPATLNITGWQDFDSKIDWKRDADTATDAVALTPGSEGAGTVARLIKDLRLPTDANTNPFAPDMGGKPVPGGKYTQFTLEYVTDRRHIGGQVMGALDKSITTHIFFIESAALSDFEAALTAISITPANAKVNLSSGKTIAKTPAAVGSKQ